jgi:hypothetical protein
MKRRWSFNSKLDPPTHTAQTAFKFTNIRILVAYEIPVYGNSLIDLLSVILVEGL